MESLGHPDSIPRPCQTCRADAPTMARQRADTPVTCRADTPAEQRCPERATSNFQALGLGNPDCMPRPCQTCRADTPTMARHRGDTQTRYPVPAVVRHVSAHRRCAPERQGDRARPARPRSYKKDARVIAINALTVTITIVSDFMLGFLSSRPLLLVPSFSRSSPVHLSIWSQRWLIFFEKKKVETTIQKPSYG